MSSASEDASKTPDRKPSQSSLLLNTFRNLTQRRLTNATPPLPSTVASPLSNGLALSTKENESAVTVDGEISAVETFEDGLVLQSQSGDSSKHDTKEWQDVKGGPPELKLLLQELQPGTDVNRRIEAIPKICSIVEQYPISDLHAIWALASDLLEFDYMQEAIDAAYRLYRSCVKTSDKMTAIERTSFFRTLTQDRSSAHLDLRSQALADLIENGKNVESLEASIARYLCRLLKMCFEFDFDEYREAKRGKIARPNEGRELRTVFEVVSNVVSFNAGVFREEDVETLLEQIHGMCRITRQEEVISYSVKLFDKLVTFTQIPPQFIKPCVELLCDIHRQLPQVQELAWKALSNLLRSHNGPFAITEMTRVLTEHSPPVTSKTSMARGVLQVLPHIIKSKATEGFPYVPLQELFPAMKACRGRELREKEIPKLEHDILAILNLALTEDDLILQVLEIDDWAPLIDLISQCTHAWGSETVRGSSMSSVKTSSDKSISDSSGPAESQSNIISHLRKLYMRASQPQQDLIRALFLRLTDVLDIESLEFIVRTHGDERLLHPSNEQQWQQASEFLLVKVFKDQQKPRYIRLMVLNLLIDIHRTIDGVYPDEIAIEYANMILSNTKDEYDPIVADKLACFAVSIADSGNVECVEEVLKAFETVLDRVYPEAAGSTSTAVQWSANLPLNADTMSSVSTSRVVVDAVVRIFLRSLPHCQRKSQLCFSFLLRAAGADHVRGDARISALKLLFRVRADARSAVYVIASSESQSMAAVLCRTKESSQRRSDEVAENAEDDPSMNSRRDVSSPSPHSSLARRSSRPTLQSRMTRANPPLWMYPGPRALPEEPSATSSPVAFCFREPKPDGQVNERTIIDVAQLLELTVAILQREEDWEVYSYVLVHTGAQLTNHALFKGCVPQVQMLRSVICEQLRGTTFREPPASSLIKKADVAACLFHILTVLISYHENFERNAEDEMVRTFLFGIGNWDRTAKWCIHAITICCHELPMSVGKTLDSIIQKMSQIITQQRVAVDILEFLTALARMPDLYKNFRDEDFKMVFGVSWKYLQYIRYQREKPAATPITRTSQAGYGSLRHSGPSREFAAAAEKDTSSTEPPGFAELPEYVYALAYHVLIFWFTAVKLEDRPRLMDFMKRNLITESGTYTLEEQSQVVIDMMQRVAYSDRDETSPDDDFARAGDGEINKKSWIVGHSIMTIETAARSGASQIVVRRPSSTRWMTLKPHLSRPARHQVPIYTGLAAEAFRTSSYVGILPDDILQTFFLPLAAASDYRCEEPMPLPDDDATRRAIAIFDRNATVDCHKMGVLYLSEGQIDEKSILSNVTGSPDYAAFIDNLGTLTRLKGAKMNTAGLDREFNMDGEFTYCWRDRCTEIVFHIATLMPTDPNNSETILRKKSHIGNDFVTIVFNNSGLLYKFDTIASQFNYIVIVITPEARAGFVDARLERDPDGARRFYKIEVLTKPGFPDISPAAETKVVSGQHLAACVRLIALNASFFSLVWAAREGGESISPWRNRLREIKKLRQRQMNADDATRDSRVFTPPSTSAGGAMSTVFTGNHPRDSGTACKRSSVLAHAENRSSILSGSSDMERQGSETTR